MEKFDNVEYFTNRELSWLKFNTRVLHEAKDDDVKLFERLKFLSITSSNLDEFFMVRIASLKDMVDADYKKKDIAGMSADKQLNVLAKETHDFVRKQYEIYSSLLPLLKENHLHILDHGDELSHSEKKFINEYFDEFVYPVLTPMAVDASRPFPLVRNKTLNIAALIRKRKDESSKKKKKDVYLGNVDGDMDFAMVQVPSVLPRIVEIPTDSEERKIIYLEDIIEKNIDKLFLNYEVISAATFRVMRNAEFKLDEDEALDLLEEIKKKLKKRQWGEAIRLEVEERMDASLLNFLKNELNVDEEDVFRIDGPLDLTVLMKIYSLDGFDSLKDKKHIPVANARLLDCEDIFEEIKKKDILLSHPYESFDPVIDFVSKAAADKNVLAIKQTLYRVSGNSPIIKALANAADNGKQVTVLVELKARFDEENNLHWAKALEDAGAHVIYGITGFKVHAKVSQVIRQEGGKLKFYMHLSTGNYNGGSAKIYTDVSYFTSRAEFASDTTTFFHILSGFSKNRRLQTLSMSPMQIKERVLDMIKTETTHGEQGRIVAKMNALVDGDIVDALVKASSAGVKIDLIVRGICCVRPGVKGLSENIRVRSLIGKYLEHARIFYFRHAEPQIYIASADWMPRNLERRLELMTQIIDKIVQERLLEFLRLQLSDNELAFELQNSGEYAKVRPKEGDARINSQEVLEEYVSGIYKATKKDSDKGKSEQMVAKLLKES